VSGPYPNPSSAAATAMGRGNRRRDTGPELQLGSILHRRGFRYRRDFPVTARSIRVRPDFVFSRVRVAVFVDGCFWHCCPIHGAVPKANAGYWVPKLARNCERDEEVTRALQADGWNVVRVWEHEPPIDAAVKVGKAVDQVQRPGRR
jgi:DNA mismatch endonuclease (patch repair protein)